MSWEEVLKKKPVKPKKEEKKRKKHRKSAFTQVD
tara:strand:+ start:150 stop:251 length:102 start_codon:yes stop_codon:yes gene_type:complete